MSLYLRKYVGTYSVKAEYDKTTLSYPRLENGNIDPSFTDIYIPCKNGSRIVHLQRNILMACYMDIKFGRNRLKELYTNNIGDTNKFFIRNKNNKIIKFDYDSMYKELIDNCILHKIIDGDEIIFEFKDSNMEIIANVLKPSKKSCNRQPFSVKNLPRCKYTIPELDLLKYSDKYKAISLKNGKGSLSIINKINGAFLLSLVKKTLSIDTIKQDIKLKRLKSKEYFHSIGKWDEYLKFIEDWQN